MTTDTETSASQAQAKLESIMAMVKRLEHASACEYDGVEEVDGGTSCATPNEMWEATRDTDCDSIADYHDEDAARQAIEESALSVLVRGPWHTPGATAREETAPAEYEILLCTGGPAVRVRGELTEYGEPDTADIQHQDWGAPWADAPFCAHAEHMSGDLDTHIACIDAAKSALLTYARAFYFGEG